MVGWTVGDSGDVFGGEGSGKCGKFIYMYACCDELYVLQQVSCIVISFMCYNKFNI